MASKWHTLVSQKIFLARLLLDAGQTEGQINGENNASSREATLQGAIELGLRSRQLLLTMIARIYQNKADYPKTLEELAALLGNDIPEVLELQAIAGQGNSWWNHLEQLERAQSNPPAQKKSVSSNNIIAVSAAPGPDRSAPAIQQTLAALKQFSDTLAERHDEW